MSEDINLSNSDSLDLTPEKMLAGNKHQYIAFILDGMVQYVLGTDILFSAILQSEPLIIDMTDRPDIQIISIGAKYDEKTDTFTPEEYVF